MNDSKVPDWLLNVSDRIIEHMNEDHSNSVVSTLNAQHGIKDKNAKMEELQVNGYFVLSIQKLYSHRLGHASVKTTMDRYAKVKAKASVKYLKKVQK